jgi:hypothetical protein
MERKVKSSYVLKHTLQAICVQVSLQSANVSNAAELQLPPDIFTQNNGVLHTDIEVSSS